MPAQLELVRGPYDGPFRRRAFSTQVSRVRNDDPDVLLPVSESGRTDWRGLSNPDRASSTAKKSRVRRPLEAFSESAWTPSTSGFERAL